MNIFDLSIEEFNKFINSFIDLYTENELLALLILNSLVIDKEENNYDGLWNYTL